jgi:multiple sugar transport system permease protein
MNEKKMKSIMIYSGAIFLFLFCTAPFLWMVIISFIKRPDFLISKLPFSFSFNNYFEVITNKSTHIIDYLRNSIIISTLTALITTVIAGISAYSISRIKFPGKMAIPLTLLCLSLFPQISIVGYLFKLMTSFDWINTYAALIFPYITLGIPLSLWIMISQFSRVPKELDEAALVDGATRFQIFRKIIFPVTLTGFFI